MCVENSSNIAQRFCK